MPNVPPYPTEPGLPVADPGHVHGQSGLYRLHLFEGRLLSAEGLEVERQYADHRARQAAIPWRDGVLRGLEVEIPGFQPPGLTWGSAGTLRGGHDPSLPVVVRLGLAFDGQGTPMALAEDLALPIRALYDAFLAAPRVLDALSLRGGGLASAPWSVASASVMPAGAYVLAARATERGSGDGLAAAVELGLYRLPWEIPAVASAWALRGALAARWFSAAQAARFDSSELELDLDPTTGAVLGVPPASPVGLALLVVGLDERVVLYDPWVPRRPLLAPLAARWAGMQEGAVDQPTALARHMQFQHMLTESLAAFPTSATEPGLLERGFSALPPVGFLPSGTSGGSLDEMGIVPALSTARALFQGTGVLISSEICAQADGLLEELRLSLSSEPIQVRSLSALGPSGLSLAELAPAPLGRKKQKTSTYELDWETDVFRMLDAWGEAGLRLYGLDHLVRGELQLARLLLVAEPGPDGLLSQSFLAFVRVPLSFPLLSRPGPAPVFVPGPVVTITSPTNTPASGPGVPGTSYGRTTASVRALEMLDLTWTVAVTRKLALQRLEWVLEGEIAETWPLDATQRSCTWKADEHAVGHATALRVTAEDIDQRSHTFELQGLTVLAPAELPLPRVRITSPSNDLPYPGATSTDQSRRTKTSVTATGDSVLDIAWTIESPLALEYVKLSIGVLGQTPLLSETWRETVTQKRWPVPNTAYDHNLYIHIELRDVKNREADHLVYELSVAPAVAAPVAPLVNITWPANSGEVPSYPSTPTGRYTAATATLQGGEAITITWEITPGTSSIVSQKLEIGSIDGQAPNYSVNVPTSARSWPWPTPAERPDLHQARAGGFWVLVSATPQDGAGRYHQVRNINMLSARTQPLSVEVVPIGFLTGSNPELYGANSQDIVWKVSNATAALSFDLYLDRPGGTSSLIAGGIPGVAHPQGLMYSWSAAAISQLETGWNRRIRVVATEAGTQRTATGLSGTFITVARVGVEVVEPVGDQPWRSGYLWKVAWVAHGGRGAAEGLAPTYHSNVRLTYGNPGQNGVPLYDRSVDVLEVLVFLPPGTRPSGQSATTLTRRVHVDNLGFGYYAILEEVHGVLLAEPSRILKPGAIESHDYFMALINGMKELHSSFDGRVVELRADVVERAKALVYEAIFTVLLWCRPGDLGRAGAYDISSSAFCTERGLHVDGFLREGGALIELLDSDLQMAGEMCRYWLTSAAGRGAIVSELGSAITGLAKRGPSAIDWRLYLDGSPTGPRDLVEVAVQLLNAAPLLTLIGPDAFLRLLYVDTHPRTLELRSPTNAADVSGEGQVYIAGTVGTGWQEPKITFKAIGPDSSGRPVEIDLGVVISASSLDNYQFSFTWPQGSTLRGRGIYWYGELQFEATCTDSDYYTVKKRVWVVLPSPPGT